MGRTPLEAETKAANRQAALRRYAEKNRDRLRDAARARMQKLRSLQARSTEEEVQQARLRARASAAKYREKCREKIRAADAARRARSVSKTAVAAPRAASKPKRKLQTSVRPKTKPNLAPSTELKSAASKPKRAAPAAPIITPPAPAPSKPKCAAPAAPAVTPPAPAPSKPRRAAPAAPIITPPASANEGTLLFPRRRQWRRGDPKEVISANQKRCRGLRGAGLEDYNSDDSDADLPPGMCGCDNTMCQRTHKNESQNRRDWKRFHLEHPDC